MLYTGEALSLAVLSFLLGIIVCFIATIVLIDSKVIKVKSITDILFDKK